MNRHRTTTTQKNRAISASASSFLTSWPKNKDAEFCFPFFLFFPLSTHKPKQSGQRKRGLPCPLVLPVLTRSEPRFSFLLHRTCFAQKNDIHPRHSFPYSRLFRVLSSSAMTTLRIHTPAYIHDKHNSGNPTTRRHMPFCNPTSTRGTTASTKHSNLNLSLPSYSLSLLLEVSICLLLFFAFSQPPRN